MNKALRYVVLGLAGLTLLVVGFVATQIPLRGMVVPLPGVDRAWIYGGVLHELRGPSCRHVAIPGMCSSHDVLFCQRTHCGGRFTACCSNLRNLGTALEMYSVDHQGAYPERLQELLAPGYLKALPECPAGSPGCPVLPAAYSYRRTGFGYEVWCRGDKHSVVGCPRDYPRYTAEKGLMER